MRTKKVFGTTPAGTQGRCACGGRLHYEVVHRYRYTDEYLREVEVHNVPAAVCERCGDVILGPEVVEEIGARLAREFFPPRHLNLADLSLTAAD
jgi:YgiT-type zinc finger domain-containing protein